MIQSAAMVRPRSLAVPLIAGAFLAIAGCSEPKPAPGLEQTVLAASMDYLCEGGVVLHVDRSPDARFAKAAIGDRVWTLTRVDSASQEKYSEGFTSLYLDGEVAAFESDGRLIGGKCQSKVPMPKAPVMRTYDLRAPTF